MSEYRAPVEDLRFDLRVIAGLGEIAGLPGLEEAAPDLVDAVLEEAGRFAAGVLAPLNRVGDEQGSRLENGVVRTPDGFREAYAGFVEGGWGGLPIDPEHGGMGLPWSVYVAVTEMWNAANTAFALCPMLTQGAIEALAVHGSDAQKALWLPKLVSGEWTGTMNLTEPQAGSDVGALRSRAVPDGDRYRITGQKIFITWGDHDCAGNIVHLVLARLPDAPEGVRGISLFIVPKYLPDAAGRPGEPNDVRCVSLEHKLGIHASPTAVLSFGDNDGAIGWLLGDENRGMACMFTMMNSARMNVGLLGVGAAERAYQQALAFARERVQGHDIAGSDGPVTIINHPDVRRMLMDMKAHAQAGRGMTLCMAGAMDRARRHPDPAVRKAEQNVVDVLTPVVKAWCTDMGVAACSTGIQVHGGMGFIEETGAAQHYRDARIHPIYEGTNGIQGNDLLGRKLLRDGGEGVRAVLARMAGTATTLAAHEDSALAAIGATLAASLDDLEAATGWLLETGPGDIRLAAAGAVPYLGLFGDTVGGWVLARAALAAREILDGGEAGDGVATPDYCEARILTARFFADHVLVRSGALRRTVTAGGGPVVALAEAQF